MTTTIKWKWWYPAGCIDGGGLEETELIRPWDGEDAATEIVQAYIDENGTDGSTSFEIEIVEPAEFAGIFDVAIEWAPSAVATARQTEAA